MAKLRILVYKDSVLAFESQCSGGIEVGRQSVDVEENFTEPEPFAICDNPKFGQRLIVVSRTSNEVPRRCFALHEDAGGIRVKNIHSSHPVLLSDGRSVEPRESLLVDKEALIELGENLAVRVELVQVAPNDDSPAYYSLNSRPVNPDSYKPGQIAQTLMQTLDAASGLPDSSISPSLEQANAATMEVGDRATPHNREFEQAASTPRPRESRPLVPVLDLLQKALEVVREASGSDAFLAASVRAAGEIVGLDRVELFELDEAGQWTTQATYDTSPHESPPSRASQTLLRRVTETGLTQIFDAASWQNVTESLAQFKHALASPVLGKDGAVIGILYGDRGGFDVSSGGSITEIEATFIEILAGAVAAGLARKDEEERRGALAGFFSPRVADLLSSRPELLNPREAEVSVLFCDIRGFSGITENAGPELTFEWLQDVLSEISQCVVDLDGVLVDYVGDQLFASWGAPDAQADHHRRALQAGTAILEKTSILQERWADRIGKSFALGIGISTGYAQAGNVGSRQKFKYGVLGNTVNLGSRLQDASKQLGVDCVAEAACVKGAGWESKSRRLTKLQVAGIRGAVEAYEIVADVSDRWLELKAAYESALEQYEAGRFAEATSSLGNLLQRHTNDRPCQMLLNREVTELGTPTPDFTGVLKLVNK